MGTGTWSEQMDTFQELFIGMTAEEVQDWYDTYCSDANGRPLQESSSGEGDADKYAALSDDDKAMLADITASATMTLNDSHGNIPCSHPGFLREPGGRGHHRRLR